MSWLKKAAGPAFIRILWILWSGSSEIWPINVRREVGHDIKLQISTALDQHRLKFEPWNARPALAFYT